MSDADIAAMQRELDDEAMALQLRERGGRWMDAYYYGFSETGNPDIDLILAAVAAAGKGFHNTESWNDDDEWSCSYGPEGREVCYRELIQRMAQRAARKAERRVTNDKDQEVNDEE